MLTKLLCFMLAVSSVSAVAVQRQFTTKLDHFGLGEDDQFRIRYLVDDEFYYASVNDTSKPRPILFYPGNEGDIWEFYENSGFITKTLAERWGALVVFGEHRYFGESFPFYDKKGSLKYPRNKYLTVDNTMLDYVALLANVKKHYGAENKAVIAMGGSYGGMLAAWMRMKFPHAVQGALAASAPIFYFDGADDFFGPPETQYWNIITKDFADTYPDKRCANGIQEAFQEMHEVIANNETLWEDFSLVMKTCKPIDSKQDVLNLYKHIQNALAYMAMNDYPEPTNFLNPMPAWPVNVSCEAFKDWVPASSAEEIKVDANYTHMTERQVINFRALRDAANVYFNFRQHRGYCMNGDDIEAKGNGTSGAGWDVLQCNQLAMPNSTGSDSMFYPDFFDYKSNTEQCVRDYGLTPDYDWPLREFGGYNIKKDLKSYSNIVFSSGSLDPWRAGGVQGDQYFNINNKLPFYVIKNGAHHLDLRLPSEADIGTDVEWVREAEASDLEGYILKYQAITEAKPIVIS